MSDPNQSNPPTENAAAGAAAAPGSPPPAGAPAAPAAQGQYYAPPGGAPGQYPPSAGAPGQYPPPPGAPGQYPPPTGAPGQYPPPTGAPGQYPPPAGTPGQNPPPAGAPGQYPPPAGAPGQYPPPAGAPGQYPPPAGAPAAPGAAPQAGTPGQYPPPAGAPGHYPPPGGYYGQYPPPGAPGQYPGYAPQGYPYYPPPTGYPGYPPYGYAPPPQGYPPQQGYPPPAGAPPSTAPGAPETPGQPAAAAPYYPPYGAPQQAYPPAGTASASPAFPTASAPGIPAAPAPATTSSSTTGLPLWYLGREIVDPLTPRAAKGVTKVPGYDPVPDWVKIQAWTSETDSLTELKYGIVLLNLTDRERDALDDYFVARSGRTLLNFVEERCASEMKLVARGLALGPLWFDVDLLRSALAGFGTNEMILTELLLNRPQDELRLLIAAYKQRYGKDLIDAVKSDLSGKLERLFVMALNCQRPADSIPVDPTQVSTDVEVLVTAAKKKDEMPFIEIFVNRSHPHLAAVITQYSQRHKSLSKVVKKTFSGDIERALLFILHGVKQKRDGQGIWRDAKLLEKTMAGLGTRDTQLVYRTLRAHWNPHRMEAIKEAYKNRFGKTLEARIRGETSGSYRDLLVKVVRASETTK